MLFFIPSEASLFFEGYKYEAGIRIKAEGKVVISLMMDIKKRAEDLSAIDIRE